jgi:uncharacterized protein YbaP (TraB family)
MSKHRYLFIACWLICFSFNHTWSQVYNQPALLWKISGKDLLRSSYLYGTVHSIGKQDFFLPNETKAAFVQCKVLATENASIVRYFSKEDWARIGNQKYLPQGKTLSEVIEPEDYDTLVKYMRQLKVYKKEYLRLKPFYIGDVLFSKQFKLTSQNTTGYELVFWRWALRSNKAGKPMAMMGLEETKQTLAALDSLDTRQQVKDLLKEVQLNFQSVKQLIVAYKAQDITSLYEMSAANAEEYRILVKNRNLEWLDNIDRLVHAQPTFIAVGAAHLAGEYGLIQLLQELGYEVTPLPEKEAVESN